MPLWRCWLLYQSTNAATHDGNCRHREVGPGEHCPRRVDAYEDLCNGLNIKVLGQLDQANGIFEDCLKSLERIAYSIPGNKSQAVNRHPKGHWSGQAPFMVRGGLKG
jgi:hypothetical protein